MFKNTNVAPSRLSETLRRLATFALGVCMIVFLCGIPRLFFGLGGIAASVACVCAFLFVPVIFLIFALRENR
ncbi:MAG: hypothetical protein ACI4QA_05190 [Candidatus Spyradosoma sp.]